MSTPMPATPPRIAFVAMPFRTKSTHLPPGKGPSTVDFDALWERAILPALTDLHYMPIRADNQTGAVIIKDMLQQLVFADLVLADISIPNGNVYYEAGVRHAAKATGCILISADWTRPLFDLEQITQLRYGLPREHPSDEEYRAIYDTLVAGIPPLADSEGPVYSLTRIGDEAAVDTQHLKELSSAVFEFQTRLQAARYKAADGDKSGLRQFLNEEHLERLPAFALRELAKAVRDNLNWGELMALLERFPERVKDDPFFLEQEALALGKLGEPHDAIALLEQIVKKFGETPERLGTIGGRYRELARNSSTRQKRNQRQSKAVEAYRRGMLIDLNQYYCAFKLMVALTERARAGDAEEARQCADHVKAACERARALDRDDEWLDSTQLIHAFFTQNIDSAQEFMHRILDRGWSNWKLMGLAKDLTAVLTAIDDDKLDAFQEILNDLQSVLPVSQNKLMEDVLPRIREAGGHYKKITRIHARPAEEGEVIVSTTQSGEETSNTAGPDDMVIKNLTEAKEEYLIGRDKFDARYAALEPVDDTWTVYAPNGEIRATEITHELTSQLDVGDEFYIMAPWSSEQFAQEGDYLVAPLPDLSEIYRIGRAEFEQTYGRK